MLCLSFQSIYLYINKEPESPVWGGTWKNFSRIVQSPDSFLLLVEYPVWWLASVFPLVAFKLLLLTPHAFCCCQLPLLPRMWGGFMWWEGLSLLSRFEDFPVHQDSKAGVQLMQAQACENTSGNFRPIFLGPEEPTGKSVSFVSCLNYRYLG